MRSTAAFVTSHPASFGFIVKSADSASLKSSHLNTLGLWKQAKHLLHFCQEWQAVSWRDFFEIAYSMSCPERKPLPLPSKHYLHQQLSPKKLF